MERVDEANAIEEAPLELSLVQEAPFGVKGDVLAGHAPSSTPAELSRLEEGASPAQDKPQFPDAHPELNGTEEVPFSVSNEAPPELNSTEGVPHPATLVRPLDELRALVGVPVRDDLLALSMTHPSAVGEGLERTLKSNQRLEFLGDSLVGAICAEYFFRIEPQSPEGALTNRKISAVRKDALASAAKRLELGDFLSFGRGEDIAGGRERHSNLSDAFEALIAAIFLSNDWNTTRDWALAALAPELNKDASTLVPAKNRLQERTQAMGLGIPRYQTTQAAPKAQWFRARVWVGHDERGQGEDKSKKKAEEIAAAMALAWLDEHEPPSTRTVETPFMASFSDSDKSSSNEL